VGTLDITGLLSTQLFTTKTKGFHDQFLNRTTVITGVSVG